MVSRNKITVSFLIGIFLLFVAVSVRAQNSNASVEVKINGKSTFATSTNENVSKKFKANLQETIEVIPKTLRNTFTGSSTGTTSRNEAVKEKIDAFKVEREKIQDGRLAAVIERTVRRLQAGVDRQTILADRIASRIKKFKAQNINESVAEALLVEANLKIDAAQIKVDAVLAAKVTSTTTVGKKESLLMIQNLTDEAIEALKEAHRSLVTVVTNIQEARPTQKTATTTNSQ